MSSIETKNPKGGEPYNVGVVLLSEGVQLLDVSAIDLLGMIEPYYLRACGLPEDVIVKGVPLKYHYITESGEGPMQMTGGFRLAVTDSIHTCPLLDILLVGGPTPDYRPSEPVQEFLRTQLEHVFAFIAVCTGYLPPLHSGILSGKVATAPRSLLPLLKDRHRDVAWEDKRWARDGKVWTSGGITNGLDLMAAFMRETFDGEMVEAVLRLADVGGRGQEYVD